MNPDIVHPSITSFTKEHVFLSNFFPCPITMHGLAFPSSEHLYQWHKLLSVKDREVVRNLRTPGQAKRYSLTAPILPDWDTMRTGVMLTVVMAKFQQNPDLMLRLKATAPMLLIEGNNWHDIYWGCVPQDPSIPDDVPWYAEEWRGENHLGRILMIVRDYL